MSVRLAWSWRLAKALRNEARVVFASRERLVPVRYLSSLV